MTPVVTKGGSGARRVLLDYPHRMAGHCGSGALRDLLEWAGLSWGEVPREGLVFGMGGGLAFTYLRLATLRPPVYLVGRSSDLEVDLLTRLGAKADLRDGEDPVVGWDWVRSELQLGRPVMVWADIGELPYLKVRLEMSRHVVVVIGYDDATEVAYIVDNDRAEVQEVPYAMLARARASRSFPVPTRHTTYLVRWPSQLPDLRRAAASALAASVQHLEGGRASIIPGATQLPPDAITSAGLAGVEIFAEDVQQWPDLMSEADLDVALRSLTAFVEKAGTGGGLFRRLQSQFCFEVAHLTDSAESRQAGVEILRCADAWSALAAAGRSDDAIGDRWRAVAAAARRLPGLEVTAVATMALAASALEATEKP